MHKIIKLILAILLCQSAGLIGSVFTAPGLEWYSALLKPGFTPPNMVFGPVWTVLYTLMGISLYLILVKETKINKLSAYILFGIQIVLNPIWSYSFFYINNLLIALIIIFTIDIIAIFTTYQFSKISRDAAILMTPYIYWILFATALNFAVWQLN